MVFLVLAAGIRPVEAQTPWRWVANGNVFAGANYQSRKFTDFKTLESQNWMMGSGEKDLSTGTLVLSPMLSFEPFTLKKLGSPQVFQTGETFERAPLIDYQHPHDLFMGLGMSYTRPLGAWALSMAAGAPGPAALGPEPYMHRASAAENPQAPLAHHQIDSTHITPGVLTAGLSRNGAGVQASWFRGREPDEDRLNLDLGALDSWAVRGTWKRGPWSAQASGGHLHDPEINEPGRNITRLTASIAHTRSDGPVSTASLLAWGQNREAHGTKDAFLFESTVTWLGRNHFYSRAELVTKDILSAGTDPVNFIDFHPFSRVGAFTLGYMRDLTKGMRTRLGLGGDVTMYYVPPNLKENYGGPVSLHLFLRYRFTSTASHDGVPGMEGMEHH